MKRRERAVTDDDYLKDVLLETKRLWPPFLGGRRIAKKVFRARIQLLPDSCLLAIFTLDFCDFRESLLTDMKFIRAVLLLT